MGEVILPAAVRVPGSSANLGPGFDVLGLALEIYLEARVERSTPGKTPVRLTGPHIERISTDDSNLVLTAFRTAFQRADKQAPPVSLELRNGIPLARGLGSSGAAAVAGATLANHCGRLGLSRIDMVALAAELEAGHADNVAASCLGGLAVACRGGSAEGGAAGGIQVLALPWPQEIVPVLAIPQLHLETQEARSALPNSYSRADAVFNLQRVALLVGALVSGRGRELADDSELFAAALADRLHQPYRAPLVPGLREALGLRVPGLLGVALSGAGPSLIAFVRGASQPTVAALEQLYRDLRLAAEVRPVKVDTEGARMIND